jgi:hypothetical protein
VKIFFSIFCCLCLIAAKGQLTIDKTVAAIPEALKKDADVVYRLDKAWLNISSPSEYSLSVHQVITILNSEGANHLRHRFGFDKFYKVEDVDIKLYDEKGNFQKKYNKKDFEIEAAYDGISLVTDDKVMTLYTPAPSYPCTIEVQYTIKVSGYIELPNWHINTHDASTELFRYEVTVPSEIDIRQRTLNLNVVPSIEILDKKKKYVWEVKNVTAKKLESEGFEPALYLPQVEVAPNDFSYDGYKGSFKTWADFSAWNYKLYEEKTPFSPERINEIKALVAPAKTRDEKIDILYKYMQRNMRYVSIQLGIGGFKPFAVKFVDEKRYGDCKALTNYMRYLLQAAGITSHPALINAGNNKIPADPLFPTDPFNHVILCIPTEKDTTWLECTSNTSDVGVLGGFTENKKALLITEQGGVLINTPKSLYNKNRLVLNNEVNINAGGGGQITGKITGTGEIASLLQYASELQTEEQKEMLVNYIHCKNPEELVVTSLNMEGQRGLQVSRTYNKLYEFTVGNKYFFMLSVNKFGTANLKTAKRETAFLFSYPYEKTDTTVYKLSSVFELETIPANKEITTEHAVYKRLFSYDKNANKLIVISYIALKNHVIPAVTYPKLVQFFKAVAEAEDETIVFARVNEKAF